MDDVGLPAGDEFIKYEVDITPDTRRNGGSRRLKPS